MVDINNKKIEVGQRIKPAHEKGRELLIVSYNENVEGFGSCFFGQQILDPLAFSVLTEKDLKENWEIVGEKE